MNRRPHILAAARAAFRGSLAAAKAEYRAVVRDVAVSRAQADAFLEAGYFPDVWDCHPSLERRLQRALWRFQERAAKARLDRAFDLAHLGEGHGLRGRA